MRLARRGEDGTWTTELVDGGRDVQTGVGLAFSTEGKPGVAYGWGSLKFAEKTSNNWSIQTVARSAWNDVTSVVYRGTVPFISFFNGSGNKAALALAYRPGAKWVVETVDKAGAGRYNSLAFDSLGRPVIAYAVDVDRQWGLETLKVAVRTQTGWKTSVVETGTVGFGVFAGLAFSSNGTPIIVHGNGDVRVMAWSGDWGTGVGQWVLDTVLDDATFAGGSSVRFIGEEPVVSWRQTDGDGSPTLVNIAQRGPDGWDIQTVTTIEWPSNTSWTESLAVDSSGQPAVSFGVSPERDLLFARMLSTE